MEENLFLTIRAGYRDRIRAAPEGFPFYGVFLTAVRAAYFHDLLLFYEIFILPSSMLRIMV
ncbi:MAG TPA: hypothetical protein PLY57_11120, partial [Deltaproteobacteria bacterium]|nr:hypothetical protein [Deltaproteobacteria bacterium]